MLRVAGLAQVCKCVRYCGKRKASLEVESSEREVCQTHKGESICSMVSLQKKRKKENPTDEFLCIFGAVLIFIPQLLSMTSQRENLVTLLLPAVAQAVNERLTLQIRTGSLLRHASVALRPKVTGCVLLRPRPPRAEATG